VEHPTFRNNAIKGWHFSVKNRWCSMAVKHYGEIYQRQICGNKVEVVEVSGGTLMCCGKGMKSIKDKAEITVNLPDSGVE
jgi:desulfoferrodoxin-like iron-binding protein